MRIEEYAAHDATALAELIRRGEVSAAEAQEAARAAIALVDGELNAVADGPWEEPLAHDAGGPFGGVPFVLKDLLCHAAGVPTRSGSRLLGDGLVFEHDSILMSRFRAAGFATLGVSTSPEFGLNVTTEGSLYGATRNPWDLARSAGGSSGGTAALVAAGALAVGHANDGAGSIRIPAAFTGLVGLKPSRGRIPAGPDFQEVVYGNATELVLSRTVRDTARVLDAVAGGAPGEHMEIAPPVRPFAAALDGPRRPLRVAVHVDSWSPQPVDSELVAAVERVAAALEAAGHLVERATPPLPWEAFVHAMALAWSAFTAQGVVGVTGGAEPAADALEPTSRRFYERGVAMRVVELAEGLATFNAISRGVGDFFADGWDVLLTPTTNVPAFPLGQLDPGADDAPEEWVARVLGPCPWPAPFNVTGTPAISVPAGLTSGGLPIGVQLAAPMAGEETLIALAAQLEEALPWADRRPPLHVAAARSANTRSTEE
ncbi:MAG: amidase [Actinobacteria bacterium]|nr:amidase [Actinomycetota bacterium]